SRHTGNFSVRTRMHYGGKLDIRVTVLWILGDETEEGEVYDGSDQEEADSDTGTRVYEAPENNSYDGRSQCSRLYIKTHWIPLVLARFKTISVSTHWLQSLNASTKPEQPGSIPTLVLPSDGMAASYRRAATAERYSLENDPKATGPSSQYTYRKRKMNARLPIVFHRVYTSAKDLSTNMTILIRLNQMSRMHQMYQKACEFYERAAAKVVSAGLNLPLAVPPKPPPVSLLLPQPGPPQPAPPVRRPGDSNATHYPIVSSGDPNAPSVTKSSEAHLPPHVPQPETMVPPAPALSADRSNYSLAYAAAYKQTVGTIPPPENGGPAPNTPEYSALWQRYMDYYLRYYMQAYASMVPNGPSKPGAAINPPETTTVSPTKTSVSATTEEEKPVPPKTSQSKEDENSPALKRPKLSEKVNTEASVKTDNGKQDTASDVEVSSQTTQPAEQPTETPKATAPPLSSDDIKSSKCIWISNLPQGVKAVDVKERCTPFGRRQPYRSLVVNRKLPKIQGRL
ncbi:hypothetical protein CLF_113062, partial [Clonorchis sinensis]